MSFYPKEFKEAISLLSHKEKDKLILRLLKKDLALTNKLMFELVDTSTVEERRAELETHIIKSVSRIIETYYSIGYLNMDVRYLSGDITEHVKTTKDKYGEASLNLLLLTELLKGSKQIILESRAYTKLHKFLTAIIARVYKVMVLINKMDNDLLLDFKEDLQELAELIIGIEPLMKVAINNALDINWLINTEIPEDIVEIQKELRANGFLK
ncbi:MAG: hypothetical protein ACPG4Y_02310 [Chitinophagales bacterium]